MKQAERVAAPVEGEPSKSPRSGKKARFAFQYESYGQSPVSSLQNALRLVLFFFFFLCLCLTRALVNDRSFQICCRASILRSFMCVDT
jgi:hypothetical protein